MAERFDIDTLASYSKEMIPDTGMLINPQYRKLENELRPLNGKLSRQRAKFAKIDLTLEEPDDKKLKRALEKTPAACEDITLLEDQIALIKEKKGKTDRKITFGPLPEQEKFSNVINDRKRFMDNIKMITCRAETSMYHLIKPLMNVHHREEGRKLLQQIYASDADIIADYKNQTLTVRIHNLNYKKDDKVVQLLCEKLNETETQFPGTNLTLIYKLVSS